MTLIQEFVGQRTPADLYETYLAGSLFDPWADLLLAASPPSGACLDIACGTGVVSRKLSASDTVSDIAAIDIAGPMIDKAKSLQSEGGLARRADFSLGDAMDLPFADDTFDAAYCQQGMQFFPDKVCALGEAGRVLKPGASLCASVWTLASDGNPVFGALEEILVRHCGEEVAPLGPFSLGDRDAIAAMASDSGLEVTALDRHELVVTLPSARDMVLFDLLFLGKPGPDGTLQPVIAPDDAAMDPVVEQMIDELTAEVDDLRQPDGTLQTLSTAHVLVAVSR